MNTSCIIKDMKKAFECKSMKFELDLFVHDDYSHIISNNTASHINICNNIECIIVLHDPLYYDIYYYINEHAHNYLSFIVENYSEDYNNRTMGVHIICTPKFLSTHNTYDISRIYFMNDINIISDTKQAVKFIKKIKKVYCGDITSRNIKKILCNTSSLIISSECITSPNIVINNCTDLTINYNTNHNLMIKGNQIKYMTFDKSIVPNNCFNSMINLKYLTIDTCDIDELNLSNLVSLKLLLCIRLDAIKKISLYSLDLLSVFNAPMLKEINCHKIDDLTISSCSSFNTLNVIKPNISTIMLEDLKVSNNIFDKIQVNSLEISQCDNLTDEIFVKFSNLKKLIVSSCKNIKDIRLPH